MIHSKGDFLFSSESVTEGHPDKMADQISDAVLDAILTHDPQARVACETLITTGLAMIAGEISTQTYVHLPDVIRKTVQEIGYDDHDAGFDYKTCAVMSSIDQQSPDIAQGVVGGKEIGAGDQGMMFGYACKETDDFMPAPIQFSHALTRRLAETRKKGVLDFLRPDGKAQVTLEYRDSKPVRASTVVVSTQHRADTPNEKIREGVIEEVIKKALPSEMIDAKTQFLINPTGRFVVGGPQGDCGLTGRKIIVDTYGGAAPHGGGAFSGKDATKVDRSACYMARYIAKNLVAAGVADRIQIQLAYAIGVAEPVSVLIQSDGSEKVPTSKIEAGVREIFGLKPADIIRDLGLREPIFRKTASYGHFGRSDVPWEKIDKVADIQRVLGL
ncbi:MAG: methionine adenosyltransferase [Bradymonadales bacterium]|nr:MAG: methionine adenosyltransferase [Bradymonadales bacterium]